MESRAMHSRQVINAAHVDHSAKSTAVRELVKIKRNIIIDAADEASTVNSELKCQLITELVG